MQNCQLVGNGLAWIEYEDDAAAVKALGILNGLELGESKMQVSLAPAMESGPRMVQEHKTGHTAGAAAGAAAARAMIANLNAGLTQGALLQGTQGASQTQEQEASLSAEENLTIGTGQRLEIMKVRAPAHYFLLY